MEEIHKVQIIHWQDNNEMLSLYINDSLKIHGDNTIDAIDRIFLLIDTLRYIGESDKYHLNYKLDIQTFICKCGTDFSNSVISNKLSLDNDFNNIKSYLTTA